MNNVGKKGTIHVIACGGCGINIVGNLLGPLNQLGSGFANVKVDYIDTSVSNVREFDYDDNNFHLVKSTNVSGGDIDGSGGERRTNSTHIIESVKSFIDSKKLTTLKVSTFYIVVASASGGTGSVISPMVTKNLLDKGLPTIAMLIGDSSNGLSTINTLNTLATFDAISKQTKKPLSIIYNDNAKAAGTNITEKLESVDKEVFRNISVLSAFLSGENTSLDQKDMAAFMDQSVYTTIGIKPGLYSLSAFAKDIKLPNHVAPTIGRSLSTPDVSPDTGLHLLHHKSGTTTNENVISMFKGQFPIHLVSYSNGFSIIEMELKGKIEEIKNRLDASTVDEVSGDHEADDDGLVF